MRYTDPSGHLACDAEHVAEGDCSDWIHPIEVFDWSGFNDDPIELMTRAMLSEEGIKYGTEKQDDVIGIGWAVRNRHDTNFFDRNLDGEEDELAWLHAAVSTVGGMGTRLAKNPADNWQSYFESSYELFVTYNNLREISQDIVNSDPGSDITLGATHWADAYGVDIDGDLIDDKTVPYERTHFYNWGSDKPAHCVITVPSGQCH